MEHLRAIPIAIAVILVLFSVAKAETYSVGGRIMQGGGDPAKSSGGYTIVERFTSGTAKIIELVEDPADATQVYQQGRRGSVCEGFRVLTGPPQVCSDLTVRRQWRD
jgi:hypothetical protein